MNVFIETDHLILRTVTPADVQGVASSWKLDEEPLSSAEAQQKIASMLANHAQNKNLNYAFTIRREEYLHGSL